MNEKVLKKISVIMALLLVATFSFFFIADWAGSANFNMATIKSIDNKTNTVLKLTATATLASAGISAIPDDTATPIANKLTDFVEYFLLILCVLYAEKYLLTLIGAGVFKILIPIACALGIFSVVFRSDSIKYFAKKCAIFGISLFIVIPSSIYCSDMIYQTYEDSFSNIINETESFTNITTSLTEEPNQNKLFAIIDSLKESVSGLTQKASSILNKYIQALAVMIVTTCVIPILAMLFFIWIIRAFFGTNISSNWLRPPILSKNEKHPILINGQKDNHNP